jgi:hypothetical protein
MGTFGGWGISDVFFVVVAEVSVATWTALVKHVLDSAFRFVPDLAEVFATEEHQEGADEFIRLLLPLLDEITFDVVDDLLAFVLHLVDLVLQTELLLAEERHVELLGGVAALQVPADVQVVVFDDAGDDRRCGNAWKATETRQTTAISATSPSTHLQFSLSPRSILSP